jgi:hypothetical protein
MSSDDFDRGVFYQKYILQPYEDGIGKALDFRPSSAPGVSAGVTGDDGRFWTGVVLGWPVTLEVILAGVAVYAMISPVAQSLAAFRFIPSLGLHPILGLGAAFLASWFYTMLHRFRWIAISLGTFLTMGWMVIAVVVANTLVLKNNTFAFSTLGSPSETVIQSLRAFMDRPTWSAWTWMGVSLVCAVVGRMALFRTSRRDAVPMRALFTSGGWRRQLGKTLQSIGTAFVVAAFLFGCVKGCASLSY